MKKLLTLLTLVLGVCSTQAATGNVYQWTHNEVLKSLKVTAAKGTGAASTYSKYAITYNYVNESNGQIASTTCSTAIKMESATTLTFTTSAKSNITVGVVLKNGVSYTSQNATLNIDGVTTVSALTEDATGATTENAVYAVFTDVAAGTHVIKRAGSELGVCYIKVEETGATLTQLTAPTITIDSSNGEVTIGAVSNASKITYTTDGTSPTDGSTEYTGVFTVEDGVTVKAIAIGDNVSYSNSDVASATALLDNVVVATPVIKQYNGTVAITCETANTIIEFSLDGTSYNTYSRAFTLSEDATVYARAKRGTTNVSDVATATVTTIGKGTATKTLWIGHDMFDDNTSNVMTGKGGTDADGFKMAITGNETKKWSYGSCDINVSGKTLQTIKLSNGAQNTLTLPAGLKATRITFYSVINSAEARTSYWKEFNGENINSDVPMGAWNTVSDRLTNPDVRVFPLTGTETSITFTNAGEQLLFVIAIDIDEASTYTKTITSAGYATLYCDQPLNFEGTGLTAYIATVSGSTVNFSTVTSVPANTGVLLKGTAGDYEIPVAASTTDVSANKFEGVLVDTELDGGIYVLMNTTEKGVGFYKTTAAKFLVGANTAYLPANVAGGRSFIGFDSEETTGIGDATRLNDNVEMINNNFFDLQGRRVAQPTKGLYIVNGKKVVK